MTSFEHDGKTYELKMTRAGIRAAEAQGLRSSEMSEQPFTALYLLFYASLFSQYKLNPNKTNAILDELLDAETVKFDELFTELSEAYVELFGLGESA